jgi:hypothetical protein
MRKYCKAYHVKDFRRFRGWTEKREAQELELSDEEIVYLWDDFTVVTSPIVPEKGVIFDTVTPEWQKFCQNQLHFVIPEDLAYAYEQAQKEDQQVPDEG